jgi:hypothetical protein
MDAIKTADDAKQAIAELHRARQEQGEGLAKNKAAVKDLSDAVRVLSEKQDAAARPSYVQGTDENALKRYVHDDGIQLHREQKRVEYAGRTYDIDQPGLLDDPNTACDWQRDLQRALRARGAARMAMRNPRTPNLDADVVSVLMRAPQGVRAGVEKAFNDSSGVGAEWIPDEFSTSLYEAFETPRRLASSLQSVTVSSGTFLRPRLTTGVKPYIKGQITSDDPSKYTASTPVTAQASITVAGLAVRVLLDDNASEDSAIVASTTLQRLCVQAIDDGYEDCMLNGDTTATHQDTIAAWNIRSRWGATGLGGTADHRRAFLGWRAYALDTSGASQSGTATAAGHLAHLALLGERGASDLMSVTSPEYMIATIMGFSEVLTLDKFGSGASVLSGQIASLFGVPIVLSRFMGADLNASGVYDDTTKTKTGLVTVDRAAWMNYARRGTVVETAKEISSGHIEIVCTVRRSMHTPDASGVVNLAYDYNIV